ncbi:hypothetical protein NDU88_010661 [Pleurodeles waltl]|uniref:Uncharacterized protein n=1 Tax=Pleurodeles waltl TaxID=8319 RepID=A0AAV7S1A4_PLEWA|nr:hypothetical protein NDU88_010661 [Pleurodeles waltl]
MESARPLESKPAVPISSLCNDEAFSPSGVSQTLPPYARKISFPQIVNISDSEEDPSAVSHFSCLLQEAQSTRIAHLLRQRVLHPLYGFPEPVAKSQKWAEEKQKTNEKKISQCPGKFVPKIQINDNILTPPMKEDGEGLRSDPSMETSFLSDAIKERLELHLNNKALQNVCGLPTTVQKSQGMLMPLAPKPIKPTPCRKRVKIVLAALVSSEAQQLLEAHLQKKVQKHHSTLLGKISESAQEVLPSESPRPDHESLKYTAEMNEGPPIKITTQKTDKMNKQQTETCVSTGMEQMPSQVKEFGQNHVFLANSHLPKCVFKGQGIKRPRVGNMPSLSHDVMRSLEQNLSRKHHVLFSGPSPHPTNSQPSLPVESGTSSIMLKKKEAGFVESKTGHSRELCGQKKLLLAKGTLPVKRKQSFSVASPPPPKMQQKQGVKTSLWTREQKNASSVPKTTTSTSSLGSKPRVANGGSKRRRRRRRRGRRRRKCHPAVTKWSQQMLIKGLEPCLPKPLITVSKCLLPRPCPSQEKIRYVQTDGLEPCLPKPLITGSKCLFPRPCPSQEKIRNVQTDGLEPCSPKPLITGSKCLLPRPCPSQENIRYVQTDGLEPSSPTPLITGSKCLLPRPCPSQEKIRNVHTDDLEPCSPKPLIMGSKCLLPRPCPSQEKIRNVQTDDLEQCSPKPLKPTPCRKRVKTVLAALVSSEAQQLLEAHLQKKVQKHHSTLLGKISESAQEVLPSGSPRPDHESLKDTAEMNEGPPIKITTQKSDKMNKQQTETCVSTGMEQMPSQVKEFGQNHVFLANSHLPKCVFKGQGIKRPRVGNMPSLSHDVMRSLEQNLSCKHHVLFSGPSPHPTNSQPSLPVESGTSSIMLKKKEAGFVESKAGHSRELCGQKKLLLAKGTLPVKRKQSFSVASPPPPKMQQNQGVKTSLWTREQKNASSVPKTTSSTSSLGSKPRVANGGSKRRRRRRRRRKCHPAVTKRSQQMLIKGLEPCSPKPLITGSKCLLPRPCPSQEKIRYVQTDGLEPCLPKPLITGSKCLFPRPCPSQEKIRNVQTDGLEPCSPKPLITGSKCLLPRPCPSQENIRYVQTDGLEPSSPTPLITGRKCLLPRPCPSQEKIRNVHTDDLEPCSPKPLITGSKCLLPRPCPSQEKIRNVQTDDLEPCSPKPLMPTPCRKRVKTVLAALVSSEAQQLVEAHLQKKVQKHHSTLLGKISESAQEVLPSGSPRPDHESLKDTAEMNEGTPIKITTQKIDKMNKQQTETCVSTGMEQMPSQVKEFGQNHGFLANSHLPKCFFKGQGIKRPRVGNMPSLSHDVMRSLEQNLSRKHHVLFSGPSPHPTNSQPSLPVESGTSSIMLKKKEAGFVESKTGHSRELCGQKKLLPAKGTLPVKRKQSFSDASPPPPKMQQKQGVKTSLWTREQKNASSVPKTTSSTSSLGSKPRVANGGSKRRRRRRRGRRKCHPAVTKWSQQMLIKGLEPCLPKPLITVSKCLLPRPCPSQEKIRYVQTDGLEPCLPKPLITGSKCLFPRPCPSQEKIRNVQTDGLEPCSPKPLITGSKCLLPRPCPSQENIRYVQTDGLEPSSPTPLITGSKCLLPRPCPSQEKIRNVHTDDLESCSPKPLITGSKCLLPRPCPSQEKIRNVQTDDLEPCSPKPLKPTPCRKRVKTVLAALVSSEAQQLLEAHLQKKVQKHHSTLLGKISESAQEVLPSGSPRLDHESLKDTAEMNEGPPIKITTQKSDKMNKQQTETCVSTGMEQMPSQVKEFGQNHVFLANSHLPKCVFKGQGIKRPRVGNMPSLSHDVMRSLEQNLSRKHHVLFSGPSPHPTNSQPSLPVESGTSSIMLKKKEAGFVESKTGHSRELCGQKKLLLAKGTLPVKRKQSFSVASPPPPKMQQKQGVKTSLWPREQKNASSVPKTTSSTSSLGSKARVANGGSKRRRRRRRRKCHPAVTKRSQQMLIKGLEPCSPKPLITGSKCLLPRPCPSQEKIRYVQTDGLEPCLPKPLITGSKCLFPRPCPSQEKIRNVQTDGLEPCSPKPLITGSKCLLPRPCPSQENIRYVQTDGLEPSSPTPLITGSKCLLPRPCPSQEKIRNVHTDDLEPCSPKPLITGSKFLLPRPCPSQEKIRNVQTDDLEPCSPKPLMPTPCRKRVKTVLAALVSSEPQQLLEAHLQKKVQKHHSTLLGKISESAQEVLPSGSPRPDHESLKDTAEMNEGPPIKITTQKTDKMNKQQTETCVSTGMEQMPSQVKEFGQNHVFLANSHLPKCVFKGQGIKRPRVGNMPSLSHDVMRSLEQNLSRKHHVLFNGPSPHPTNSQPSLPVESGTSSIMLKKKEAGFVESKAGHSRELCGQKKLLLAKGTLPVKRKQSFSVASPPPLKMQQKQEVKTSLWPREQKNASSVPKTTSSTSSLGSKPCVANGGSKRRSRRRRRRRMKCHPAVTKRSQQMLIKGLEPCLPKPLITLSKCLLPRPCPSQEKIIYVQTDGLEPCLPKPLITGSKCLFPRPCPSQEKIRNVQTDGLEPCSPKPLITGSKCLLPRPCPSQENIRYVQTDGLEPSSPTPLITGSKCLLPRSCPSQEKIRNVRTDDLEPCSPKPLITGSKCLLPRPCPSQEKIRNVQTDDLEPCSPKPLKPTPCRKRVKTVLAALVSSEAQQLVEAHLQKKVQKHHSTLLGKISESAQEVLPSGSPRPDHESLKDTAEMDEGPPIKITTQKTDKMNKQQTETCVSTGMEQMPSQVKEFGQNHGFLANSHLPKCFFKGQGIKRPRVGNIPL